jgi:hypothetical protein
MHTRFLIAGTLTGGVALSLLGWFTAAILPPRYKQFRDDRVVVETIRTNTGANGIYTAPQGVFVAVSLRPDLSNRLQNLSSHLAGQFVIEFAVALCLSVLLLATPIRSPLAPKYTSRSGIGRVFRWSTCLPELVTSRQTGVSLACS